MRGRFTGDPSFEYETTVTHRVGEGDAAEEQSTQIELKEEDRLAAVVSRIDEEVALVPRGAYIRTPLGEVILNNSFQGKCVCVCVCVCVWFMSISILHCVGLSLADAKRLNYYMHFKRSSGVEEEMKVSLDTHQNL